jgi:tetratricopeptide repeat protein 30
MIGQPTLDFLDAYLLCSVSKEEAYWKLDDICKVAADRLRRLMREVEDSKKTHDEQQISLTLRFEASGNDLIPLFMVQAKIFWDLEKYQLVELLLVKYDDFCAKNRTWKLNLAHTYFMQPWKVPDAIGLCEPLVLGEPNLLDVEAIVVANLCVAYVLMEQTEIPDALIHRLTEEEAHKFNEDASSQLYHLSIIHLVMGTLYCAHKNFDFGVDYVFKAFAPMHKKLNADTWFCAKKCLFEFLRSTALR